MELSQTTASSEEVLPDGLKVGNLKSDTPKPKQFKFDLLCKFFNKYGEAKGKEKTKLAKTFIGLLFKDNRKPEFTYNILRLLFPMEDRDRGSYGIKEKTLAAIMRDALGLGREDYEKMKHFKNPSFHIGGVGVGDFPSIVFNICVKFCKKESTITV